MMINIWDSWSHIYPPNRKVAIDKTLLISPFNSNIAAAAALNLSYHNFHERENKQFTCTTSEAQTKRL